MKEIILKINFIFHLKFILKLTEFSSIRTLKYLRSYAIIFLIRINNHLNQNFDEHLERHFFFLLTRNARLIKK